MKMNSDISPLVLKKINSMDIDDSYKEILIKLIALENDNRYSTDKKAEKIKVNNFRDEIVKLMIQ